MIIEYIRYKVLPEQREAFVQSYAMASEQLNTSEFCLAYELAECEEEAGQFLMRIEWTSTEEHLNGFRKSKDFSQFFSYVKPYFDSIQEMRHYKLTKILKRK
ncbi:MAG TPA: antibiotic biosynthesis monooxygenase family protein [Chitinophagaceae bacterium]|jgi:quinol monooxygenase YgiN|nr:antibiotic biosynthesis monooxygenase family protein [Chitinophagaceae bacterium]